MAGQTADVGDAVVFQVQRGHAVQARQRVNVAQLVRAETQDVQLLQPRQGGRVEPRPQRGRRNDRCLLAAGQLIPQDDAGLGVPVDAIVVVMVCHAEIVPAGAERDRDSVDLTTPEPAVADTIDVQATGIVAIAPVDLNRERYIAGGRDVDLPFPYRERPLVQPRHASEVTHGVRKLHGRIDPLRDGEFGVFVSPHKGIAFRGPVEIRTDQPGRPQHALRDDLLRAARWLVAQHDPSTTNVLEVLQTQVVPALRNTIFLLASVMLWTPLLSISGLLSMYSRVPSSLVT